MKKILLSVTLFNFLGAGLGFLINILLARLYPYEVFGRINILLSLNAIFIVLLSFGFNNAMVVFYNKNKTEDSDFDKNRLNFITSTYLRFLLIALPICVVITLLLSLHYKFTLLEFLFLTISPLFASIYRFIATYYQALGKWNTYNKINITFNFLKGFVLILGGMIIVFLLNKELEYQHYLSLYLIFSVVLVFIALSTSHNLIGFTTNNEQDKFDFYSILKNLGFISFIITLNMRIDNILIESILGLNKVAIYASANTLALMFPLITGSIMRVLLKETSNKSTYYLNKILTIQKKYFLHLLLLLIVLILLSPYMIRLFFGERYENSIIIFQILLVAYVGGVFFTPLESYFYNQKSRFVLKMKIFQLIFFTITAVPMLYYFSLIGLAITVIFSRLIAWVIFYRLSLKIVNNDQKNI